MVPPPPPLEPPPEREGLLIPESQLREGRLSFSLLIILEFVRGATVRPDLAGVDRSLLYEELRDGLESSSPAGFRIIRGALGALML